MIKRRFYRADHGSRDAPSESSSSSDSEVEAEATDETEDEEEDIPVAEVREKDDASSSSGYESEDSSVNEVHLDSSGLPTSDDDSEPQNGGRNTIGSLFSGKANTIPSRTEHSSEKDDIQFDECVLKSKSVFKCRICPRIVCLSEETLKSHLNSKRHSRSKKLLKEGRLKLMLNDNGQIEEDTTIDKDDTTTASGHEGSSKSKKKGKGLSKSRKRSRQNETKPEKTKPSTDNRKARRAMKNQEKRWKNDS
ncbi:hypothetical protein ACJIZ3_014553 [Penstemon smallii]|uniref:C2H2-type domain-containing protein n=1 Tax=Penstemon smallii TaxID=265156 RepID=A0ABD3RUI0_9LAMI